MASTLWFALVAIGALTVGFYLLIELITCVVSLIATTVMIIIELVREAVWNRRRFSNEYE